MDGRTGNILKYSVSILLAAALLYFAFRKVNWTDFRSALKACKWGYVLLSMFFGLCAFYIRSLRWREILLPIDRSTSRLTCFNAVTISYVVNLVLPRVGEVVRCGYITSHSGKYIDKETGTTRRLASFDKVLGTAALERSVDVILMGLILLVFLLLTWDRYGSFFSDKIFGAAGGQVSLTRILVLAGIGAAGAAAILAIFRFSDRWKPLEKASCFLKGVGQGFVSCLKIDRAWFFFLLSVLLWVCYWMMSATIVWAIQGIDSASVNPEMAAVVARMGDLTLLDAFFLMVVGSISSLVPVPGGFGAFHFIVAGAISSVYGLPFQSGMIFATLSHESQALNQVVWGAISYVDEQLRKKGRQ